MLRVKEVVSKFPVIIVVIPTLFVKLQLPGPLFYSCFPSPSLMVQFGSQLGGLGL